MTPRTEPQATGSERVRGSSCCSLELPHQFLAEVVIVHLDRVTRRGVEAPVWRRHLMCNSGGDIGRTLQAALDLQRCDARLVIGKLPDAADRLEQPDEEQV